MANYETVLAQALELPADEREMLIVSIGLSLRETTADDEFLDQWERLARQVDHLTEESLELAAVEQLFGSLASGGELGDAPDPFWDGEIKRRLEALVNGAEDELDWDEFQEEPTSR